MRIAVKEALQVARQQLVTEDIEFFHAACAASEAFRGADLRRAASAGVTAELILWVLSGKLEKAERQTLAALISGYLKRPGHPRREARADFHSIAKAAAKAFKRHHKATGGEASALIAWLSSDKPLGRAEWLTLAELIAGELNSTGRRGDLAKNIADRGLAFDLLDRKYEMMANRSSAVQAELEAVEWASRNDPRALGRRKGTLRRKMQDARPAWRAIRCRNKTLP